MALAILELRGFEKGNVRFRIDTGTNRYYRLKAGRSVRRSSGVDGVDEVLLSTKVAVNEAGGGLLNTSKEVVLPLARVASGHAYVQLFSFKTPDGRSPAFSRVLKVPVASGVMDELPFDIDVSASLSTGMNMTPAFHPPRRIPCRTAAEDYSLQASWADLIGQAVKVVGPAVLKLLGGGANGGQAAAPPAAGAGAAAQPDVLGSLLQTLLAALQPAAAPPVAAPPPAAAVAPSVAAHQPAAPPVAGHQASSPQSLGAVVAGNRFRSYGTGALSRPFIFGIDDAIIAAAIGPLVQILPQLMNSANQRRVQLKQANNKLVTDILSDMNRRRLLEQLLEAQRQAPAGAQQVNSADLQQLMQLLQQASAAAPPPGGPAVSAPQSVYVPELSSDLSARAVLSFVTGDPVPWNGAQKAVFARTQPLQLKVRFTVGEPVPKRPLPKALLKLVFKDGSDQTVWFEKTFRQKDVAPNSVLAVPFSQDDVARLPVNRTISVFAELRWLGGEGRSERKALGSTDIVLVNRYFLSQQGAAVSGDQELADMNRFRAFWNKVWEAPTLDAASAGGDGKKYHWALDVSAKYSILLSPDQEANGLMQTRVLRGTPDPDSLTDTIDGRMKAGIELSLAEVNKLLALWELQPLDRDRFQAIATAEFARSHAGEFVRHLKLKGRRGQRGMVWVAPVFRLFELTLNAIQSTDEAGQVTAVTPETVRFPLPVSARVIGLTSEQ